MRIAVIGAGISGLGAAYALDRAHEVSLFEANARLGGHANTLTIDYDGAAMAVDTGFIVYNAQNYPNLVGLLAHLGVETLSTDMSFAVSDPNGFEWSSNGLKGLFAWKRNLANPKFLALLNDIVRFSALARADLAADRINGDSLGEYVHRLGFRAPFLQQYLLPMGAAIWSTPEAEMMAYPAASFLRFFDNHRLLHVRRPAWRTVKGGSQVYVQALREKLRARIRTAAAVVAVTRAEDGVTVRTADGLVERFDHAILACHSDEALTMLTNPTPAEAECLHAIAYTPNTAYLHRDPALMPRRKSAWASWNYLRFPGGESGAVCVSYWMNLLQSLDPARPAFVTLNPPKPPRSELTFAEIPYAHPRFDIAALAAQTRMREINGRGRISFAGAWLGYGFHEDGLASGLAAARPLGGSPPWVSEAASDAPLAAAA